MYQAIKTLKGMVRSVLEDMPETRNSDITLMIEIWKRFYPERIITVKENGYEGIRLQALYDLPREDNVKRVRAKFQNVDKLFLPTDIKIAKQRGILEDDWRVAMGYPTKESTGTGQPSYTPPSVTATPAKIEFTAIRYCPNCNPNGGVKPPTLCFNCGGKGRLN